MKVTFLTDYRGVLTGEKYYKAGQVVDLPDGQVPPLVNRGIVETVAPAKKKRTRKAK